MTTQLDIRLYLHDDGKFSIADVSGWHPGTFDTAAEALISLSREYVSNRALSKMTIWDRYEKSLEFDFSSDGLSIEADSGYMIDVPTTFFIEMDVDKVKYLITFLNEQVAQVEKSEV